MTTPEDTTMEPLVRLDRVHVRHRARSGACCAGTPCTP